MQENKSVYSSINCLAQKNVSHFIVSQNEFAPGAKTHMGL